MKLSSIFNWFQDHHREKILETQFPLEWTSYLEKNVGHYQRLDPEQQKHLRDLTQVFIAEKNWEGCGGLELNDEIRVTIAAQACMLVLALPHHGLYRQVDSILVYPSTVMRPEYKVGVFEVSTMPIPPSVPLLGEAHSKGGPVILVWDSMLQSSRHPESGHNVVYHEFAHKIDMLDGNADGTPLLDSPKQYQHWVEVCSREFLKLQAQAEIGEPTFLDQYGAVNEAEFFAVITEQFFDQPVLMKKYHPELYSLLKEFYRQDPAEARGMRGSDSAAE